jgi:hypothetical protein
MNKELKGSNFNLYLTKDSQRFLGYRNEEKEKELKGTSFDLIFEISSR